VKGKPSSILLVLVITSFFLFSPSFMDFQELIESDFPSSRAKYEDRDIENFSFDKRLDLTVEPSLSAIFSLLENNLSDSCTGLSLQLPSPAQKAVTLRC
jgi:hypothetical protein